jgi:hypothetical protein
MTSASSVGVVLGNTIRVGENFSASSFVMRSSTLVAVAVRSATRTSHPRSRSIAATSASVYGGLVVPSTSSRSWQRPCRVKAMPPISGGFTRRVRVPSIDY